MVLCTVPGCASPRTPKGRLCETHKSRQRRHGHAEQRGITAGELGQYLKPIRAHIRRNRGSPLWDYLDTAWRRLVDDAEQEAKEIREQGRPAVVFHREALDQLAKLRSEVKPRSAVEAILAMYLLLEFDPRRFRSDDAFKYQLVRRVRSLSDVNVGITYDHGLRKTKRVYRDLRPRSTAALADMLIAAFGRAGLYIARHERHRLEKQGAAQQELDKALSELK